MGFQDETVDPFDYVFILIVERNQYMYVLFAVKLLYSTCLILINIHQYVSPFFSSVDTINVLNLILQSCSVWFTLLTYLDTHRQL